MHAVYSQVSSDPPSPILIGPDPTVRAQYTSVAFIAKGAPIKGIAAMAGAIGGACHGLAAFPPPAIETADRSGLDLAPLADSLLKLRRS